MSKSVSDTAICIASGPSLTADDVDYCCGKGKIYVVKECWKLCPDADVLYAADTDWWDHYNGVAEFAGARWTVSTEAAQKYGLNHIDCEPALAWSKDKSVLAPGGNSGFQALNLAVLQGAVRVILLGFDMGFKGDKHWWDKTIKRESRYSNFEEWIKRFNKAAPLIPVPVLNASRLTALECFPKVNVRDVL